MKKLQIITITALMASGVAYAALDWDGVDNLAKGASVTLSSNDSEGNRAAIVDDITARAGRPPAELSIPTGRSSTWANRKLSKILK